VRGSLGGVYVGSVTARPVGICTVSNRARLGRRMHGHYYRCLWRQYYGQAGRCLCSKH
jgi:hypothetical protein